MTRRSDGRWVDTITLPNGKRKYIYGKSKTELILKMQEFSENVSRPKLATVAGEWYSAWEKSVTWKTYNAYITAYNAILERFGDRYIKDISPLDIQLYLQQKKDEGYSYSYVKRFKTLLSKIFSFEILKKNGSIKTDPTKEAKMPRFDKRKVHAATPAQEETIRQLVREPFGLFAFLLLYTGCRSGEALALQWKDIDFDGGVIHITKGLVYEPSGPKIKPPKTQNGVRDIPLLSPLRAELERVDPKHKNYYVFGGKEPLKQKEYCLQWRLYAVKAGFRTDTYYRGERNNPRRKRITLLTPHQLRHSFATMCLEAELSPEDAQHLLGHADIQTTINIYTDIRDKKKKAAYSKLDAFVSHKD